MEYFKKLVNKNNKNNNILKPKPKERNNNDNIRHECSATKL